MYSFGGTPVWFARTGYTGEDGFEIVAPNSVVGAVWDRCLEVGMDSGLKAAGLGAGTRSGPRCASPCTAMS